MHVKFFRGYGGLLRDKGEYNINRNIFMHILPIRVLKEHELKSLDQALREGDKSTDWLANLSQTLNSFD